MLTEKCMIVDELWWSRACKRPSNPAHVEPSPIPAANQAVFSAGQWDTKVMCVTFDTVEHAPMKKNEIYKGREMNCPLISTETSHTVDKHIPAIKPNIRIMQIIRWSDRKSQFRIIKLPKIILNVFPKVKESIRYEEMRYPSGTDSANCESADHVPEPWTIGKIDKKNKIK